MRAFLIACLAILVLAVGAFYALAVVQKTAGAAYTTDGARISQKWSLRQMIARSKGAPKTASLVMPQHEGELAEDCEVSSTWNMILADFVSTQTADSACEPSN